MASRGRPKLYRRRRQFTLPKDIDTDLPRIARAIGKNYSETVEIALRRLQREVNK